MIHDGLILASRIATAIKNKKFLSFIVIGSRDIGKSTYSIKALYEAFMILADDPYASDECWEKALSCIKFRINDVTEYLKRGIDQYTENNTKLPALCWDDMRKYASGTTYFLDKELYNEITGLLDTIKIPISVFLGTCPSMAGVMGILKNFDSYQINLSYSPRGGKYRIAQAFLWHTSPKGQRWIEPRFQDIFLCRLPNKIWKKYEIDRIQASKDSVVALQNIEEKKKLKEIEQKLRAHRLRNKFKQLEEE